ncbi:DUF1801 domain-containing protein [Antarctobacter heliothermus]|uniref:YdhG-like domain-containing protein n=1 Tax=Antarctobacter heliothermus TaxID=74033 RepID=A0A239ANE1_9RHOB|nr:DUF1801 domain-containing protein [Antarctobacter heliothermus]SNR96881.1 protein of unknown function (DU1801) [Antarctobacter heliothermus]
MADRMTVPSDAPVAEFLSQVEPARRREDALILDAVFRKVTGWQPVIWGTSMVGYGRYAYTYASGHSGQSLATGFAPRKAKMVVYIMPGYADYSTILSRLGPHKLGKSCLYLGALSKVDLDVLAELIRAGLKDLAGYWPVEAS